MTFGTVRDESLKLLNGYSIAGTEIASSYNNQADYLVRIPGLVDDAQMYIATTAKKIPATAELSSLGRTDTGGVSTFTLPSDCYAFPGTGLLCYSDERGFERVGALKYIGTKQFAIPAKLADDAGLTLMIEYYRYPIALGSSPESTATLDNVPETHYAIPYYVAAHLVMYDDFSVYASLYNEFETKLARFAEASRAENWPIFDVYDGGDGWTNGY